MTRAEFLQLAASFGAAALVLGCKSNDGSPRDASGLDSRSADAPIDTTDAPADAPADAPTDAPADARVVDASIDAPIDAPAPIDAAPIDAAPIDAPVPIDAGNVCTMTSTTISSNHGHVATVPASDVAAGTQKTYSIQGSSAHPHAITVTAAMFAMLQQNIAVVAMSTNVSNHFHNVTIRCA
jgi:hypothetical protein